MRRPISSKDLNDTLTILECHAEGEHKQGFWLWDVTRGMHLAMGEPTEQAALIEAIEYYQERLTEVEEDYKELKQKVTKFLNELGVEDANSIY